MRQKVESISFSVASLFKKWLNMFWVKKNGNIQKVEIAPYLDLGGDFMQSLAVVIPQIGKRAFLPVV